ncbi:BODG dioxygenase, partial [Polypterus senegalus]
MPGDAACLLHSLCYILYGHIRLNLDIQRNIVSCVLIDWDRFKVWTDDGTGDNYTTQGHYKSEMLKPFTYASACELMVAAELFSCRFQVYRNGQIFYTFAEPPMALKHLRFTGDNLSSGRFDVYECFSSQKLDAKLSMKPIVCLQSLTDAECHFNTSPANTNLGLRNWCCRDLVVSNQLVPPLRNPTTDKASPTERYYWSSDLRIPTVSFKKVLTNDQAALFWLTTLRSTGIVLLKGADIQQGEVAKLSERIGYLRLTFYGHTWQVQDKTDANNVAYTSEKLNLHTDYPALHHPPGVQFLHCLKQAVEGGESEIVDGFHVANLLRKTNPEAFSILSSVKVDFTDTGSDYCDFAVQSKNQIIDVDREGNVVRINYNNATRDSVLNLPVDQVQPFYDALKAFVNLLHSPDNVVNFRMESGDIVTFDNWRLLHGRCNYVSDPDSPRHFEGAYLDWDEVMSRLRILRAAVQGEN